MKNIFEYNCDISGAIIQHALDAILLVIGNKLRQVLKHLLLRRCQHGLLEMNKVTNEGY